MQSTSASKNLKDWSLKDRIRKTEGELQKVKANNALVFIEWDSLKKEQEKRKLAGDEKKIMARKAVEAAMAKKE